MGQHCTESTSAGGMRRYSNCEKMNTYAGMQYMIQSLRNENAELNNDISVLKKLVYMLNVELELRESACPVAETCCTPYDFRYNQTSLAKLDVESIEPLLRAFGETKKEKDDLLLNYKRAFHEFSQRCKEIASENFSLRQQLYECREKAESSLIEWRKLHEKFVLTKEHNQLLTRQVKLLQNKNQKVELIYRDDLKRYNDEKRKLNEEFESVNKELFLLKGKLSILSEMKTTSVIEKISQQDPTFVSAIVIELKKLSAELKLHHTKEVQTLKTQLKTLESLKSDMEIKLATITSERNHLLGHNSTLKFEMRQISSRLKIMEDELQVTKKNENDARHQVMKSMAFIREMVSNRNASFLNETYSVNTNLNSDN